MNGQHKQAMIKPARKLIELGFRLLCTAGTARVFQEAGIEVELMRKVQEGRPNLLDYMVNGDVQIIFNTPSGKGTRTDEGKIRAAAVTYGVPCVTTLPGCLAMVRALEWRRDQPEPDVCPLQTWATK